MSLLTALSLTDTDTFVGVPAVDPEKLTVPYPMRGLGPYNAPLPMVVPSPNNGGTVHPSVVDFHPTTWNGWRYWMLVTPFGNGGVTGGPVGTEDPWVFVSDDGYHWTEPLGITNPISDGTRQAAVYIGGLNTDTEFCFDPVTSTMHAWWRAVTATTPALVCWHSSSTDGVTWATPDVVFSTPTASWVCPTVARISQTEWRMWVYSGMTMRTASAPTGPWSEPVACTGHGGWHGDVIYHQGSYWAMTDGKVAKSTDGVAWATANSPALAGRAGMWDSRIYRTTIAPHPDGVHMRVWYGNDNLDPAWSWQTGYTVVPLSLWPAPPA